jgi:hypothetical protein
MVVPIPEKILYLPKWAEPRKVNTDHFWRH